MLIQTPDIARKLQRKLRLQSLPDSVLSPETVGVILVEDLSAPLAGSSRGCMGAADAGAVAAEYSHVGIIKTSDALDVVVTGVWLTGVSTGQYYLVASDSAILYTTVVDTAFTDRNIPGRPASTVVQGTNAIPSSGPSLMKFRATAQDTIFIPLDIRLAFRQGAVGFGGLFVRSQAVNVFIGASWAWTESEPLG